MATKHSASHSAATPNPMLTKLPALSAVAIMTLGDSGPTAQAALSPTWQPAIDASAEVVRTASSGRNGITTSTISANRHTRRDCSVGWLFIVRS
jgi:hypothetical protein